jgi:hypothetical protein
VGLFGDDYYAGLAMGFVGVIKGLADGLGPLRGKVNLIIW